MRKKMTTDAGRPMGDHLNSLAVGLQRLLDGTRVVSELVESKTSSDDSLTLDPTIRT